MCLDIYVQKRRDKKEIKTGFKQARKKKERKGNQFVTLSKMNNQKAHTEADKERGGQFIGKVSPPSFN